MTKSEAIDKLREAYTLVRDVNHAFKVKEITDAKISLGEAIDQLCWDVDYKR